MRQGKGSVNVERSRFAPAAPLCHSAARCPDPNAPRIHPSSFSTAGSAPGAVRDPATSRVRRAGPAQRQSRPPGACRGQSEALRAHGRATDGSRRGRCAPRPWREASRPSRRARHALPRAARGSPPRAGCRRAPGHRRSCRGAGERRDEQRRGDRVEVSALLHRSAVTRSTAWTVPARRLRREARTPAHSTTWKRGGGTRVASRQRSERGHAHGHGTVGEGALEREAAPAAISASPPRRARCSTLAGRPWSARGDRRPSRAPGRPRRPRTRASALRRGRAHRLGATPASP